MRATWKVVVMALIFIAVPSRAVISTGVEPIIGYERVQKLIPTPRTVERLVYGARITVGVPLISAEAEFTRATDTESFPSLNQTYKDTEDKARVGARSTFRLGGMISLIARAGAQAKLVKHEVTTGSVTGLIVEPIRYNPYAGAGFKFKLSRQVALTADITVVFRDFPNMNQNDYMTTAGFVVSFP